MPSRRRRHRARSRKLQDRRADRRPPSPKQQRYHRVAGVERSHPSRSSPLPMRPKSAASALRRSVGRVFVRRQIRSARRSLRWPLAVWPFDKAVRICNRPPTLATISKKSSDDRKTLLDVNSIEGYVVSRSCVVGVRCVIHLTASCWRDLVDEGFAAPGRASLLVARPGFATG